MAVNPETPYASATANGVTVFFSFSFTVLDAGDLVVTKTVGGVTTTYVLGVDYTVTGLAVNPGSINFLVAPANGVVITMFRLSALGREITYQTLGDLLSGTVNEDFDRIWYALQEMRSRSDGSIRLPYPEQTVELPVASQRAGGYFLGFDVVTGAVRLVLAGVGTATALALSLASSIGASLIGVIQSGTGAILRNVQAKTRDQFDARDYGADPASSAAVNKAALQLAINAAAAYSLSSGNTATVTIRDAYGFKIDVRSTWPDVTGVAVPIVIKDYSKGVSYAGYPTAYDGSQERIFMFTPQPPTNNHDGNTIWLRSTWAPNWCISTDADYTGARTAVDNRRASFTLFVNGTATYRMGQGTLASATLTDEELSNFIIEKYARAGDTLASAWGMFLGERKTHRMSYGGGSNAPLAAHDFFPGNTAETLDLALFRTPSSATTISLQSSAGVNARTYLRNNGGISEFGTQTGGAAIKLRQADRFAEFGAGATYTYHHNFQDARASNWIFFVNNTSASDGFVQRLQSASAQSATWSFIEGYANAGADLRFRIAGTGNVTNANNSYGAISDIKVKRDVTKVAPGKLAKVLNYEVVNFVLKDDPSNTKQIGFIAQQVREVAPGLVEEFPDFDDDHKPLGTVTLGVKHSVIATEHFAAFQEFVHEMRAEIASLKAELSAQKNTGGGATTQDTGGGTKPTTPK